MWAGLIWLTMRAVVGLYDYGNDPLGSLNSLNHQVRRESVHAPTVLPLDQEARWVRDAIWTR